MKWPKTLLLIDGITLMIEKIDPDGALGIGPIYQEHGGFVARFASFLLQSFAQLIDDTYLGYVKGGNVYVDDSIAP